MLWKRRITDTIFSLYRRVSTLHYFHFRRYRKSSLFHHSLLFLCRKYQNSVKNIISLKSCIKYYVPNFLKRFIFTKDKNIRTKPDNTLYITAILFPVFYKNSFIRTKSLILAKKR